MDPSIRKGIEKRRNWIRRNPGAAGDYIRLAKSDREKVDALFLATRRLKPNEVTLRVEELTEQRLLRRRISNVRAKALASMRRLEDESERYRDKTVVDNVKKMSPKQVQVAAAASVDQLISLARVQEQGNLFWYH